MIYIYPQAEPFFLEGNKKKALLFIHGFTASPSEVYGVSKFIHEQNSTTISGILLPGHGSHPRFLNRTTWHNWYSAVETEINFLLNNYEEVYVAGLSLGGILAIYSGIKIPEIKGVISINAPFRLCYPLLEKLSLLAKWIKPYIAKPIGNQEILKKQGRFAYECIPAKAFTSMLDLRNKTIKDLPKLTVPLLLMQSIDDESVDPKGVKLVLNKINNSNVKLVELQKSGHVATMNEDQNRIASLIIEFIGKD